MASWTVSGLMRTRPVVVTWLDGVMKTSDPLDQFEWDETFRRTADAFEMGDVSAHQIGPRPDDIAADPAWALEAAWAILTDPLLVARDFPTRSGDTEADA